MIEFKTFNKSFPFLVLLMVSNACVYRDIPKGVDCSISDLKISLTTKTDPSGCNTTDGIIAVMASGGSLPYSYSINGGAIQASPIFSALGAGTYNIQVRDANLCPSMLDANLLSNSTLNATVTTTADTGCTTPSGTIMVNASGGSPTYQYQLDGNGFGSATSFVSVKAGIHSISVKDNQGCIKTISASVDAGISSISYSNDIAPILTTYCNLPSCHGAGSSRGDWTKYTNVKANSSNIKSRTGNKSMPEAGSPALTQNQIDIIACWVTSGSPNN
jgi:hypothetical protein